MPQKVGKFVYWTPRILSILFILFLALFSFDVIQPGLNGWEIALGLFMHNIPSFVLLAVTLVAWKHEIVGAIGFILAGLLYIVSLVTTRNFEWFMLSWSVTISGPAFLVGIMYWVNWKKKIA